TRLICLPRKNSAVAASSSPALTAAVGEAIRRKVESNPPKRLSGDDKIRRLLRFITPDQVTMHPPIGPRLEVLLSGAQIGSAVAVEPQRFLLLSASKCWGPSPDAGKNHRAEPGSRAGGEWAL